MRAFLELGEGDVTYFKETIGSSYEWTIEVTEEGITFGWGDPHMRLFFAWDEVHMQDESMLERPTYQSKAQLRKTIEDRRPPNSKRIDRELRDSLRRAQEDET
jgi:hypothetical protein